MMEAGTRPSEDTMTWFNCLASKIKDCIGVPDLGKCSKQVGTRIGALMASEDELDIAEWKAMTYMDQITEMQECLDALD